MPAPNSTNDFIFDGTTRLNNINDITGLTATSITFTNAAGGFILNGNSITLAGGITNLSTNLQTINLGLILSGNDIVNASTANILISSSVSGTGSLEKAGSGTMVLANENTCTGTTLISAGALQIGNGGGTGSLGTNNITNNSSLIFNRTGAYSVASPISGSGSLTQRGTGTLILSGNNSYSGTTTVNGGALVAGSSTALGSGAGALTVNNGSKLALGSYNATVGEVTLNSGSITGSGTLTGTSYTASSGTIDPTLAGAGVTLTKTGLGSVTLNAAETFTGKTTVSAGTLILGFGASLASTEINLGTRASKGTLDASAPSGGGITIGNGQTLAGYGTLVGNTTIASGGTLAPGNSPGILGVTGSLTLNSGSTSIFEVAGSGAGVGFDQVNVTGALTYGGVLKLDITGSYNMGTAFQNYLFNFGSETGGFSSVKYNLNGSGWSDLNYYAANNTWQMWDNNALTVGADNGYIGINLNTGMLTVVPEPSTWALLVGGVSTLMILRRRRG